MAVATRSPRGWARRRARQERRARRSPSRRRTVGGLKVAVTVFIGIPLAVLGAVLAALALLLYGALPGTVPVQNERVVSIPSVVYDAEGQRIADFREFELTLPIEPDDVPEVLEEAVVAAEDQHFWEHDGLDVEGLFRAAFTNTVEGELVQGGSTITQQLVKNRFLDSERTFTRKLNEAVLAVRMERQLSKDEILFEYLDTTYFGGGAYGVGGAAQTYFRKPVNELTASEAALLAGIVPAPSNLGPRTDAAAAEERRVAVLEAMHEEGYLTDEEFEEAVAERLWWAGFGLPDEGEPATVIYPPVESGGGAHPYFVDYVRQHLVDRYGAEKVFRGGLRVETTLDPALQEAAVAAVATQLEGTEAPVDMSLVSIDPATGHVRAFVGGRDWSASQVNLALGGSLGMQPGSSFKPFVLASALERGMDPSTVYPAPSSWRVPDCVGDQCTISNYGASGYGSMSLDRATRSSVNTVYGQLIHDVGSPTVVDTATRLGVTSLDPTVDYGVSLALGSAEVSPLDMASAYSVFANHGTRAQTTPVLRVTTPDGTVLEDNTAVLGERVLHAAVADTVTDVLTGVVTSGTGTNAAIDRPAAGKTGTAEDYKAAWFVGYTPQLATAVWMGHSDEPRPLHDIGGYSDVTGGSLPAKAWGAFMAVAHIGLPVIEFTPPGALPPPEGVLTVDSAADRRSADGPAVSCGAGPLCGRPPPVVAGTPEAEDEDAEAEDEEPGGSDTQTDEEPDAASDAESGGET